MDDHNLDLATRLVDKGYITQASVELHRRSKLVRILLSQRNLPEDGWDDQTIKLFLHELSVMDSNNFSNSLGGGEREARVYSNLVKEMHYSFGHGIGRSGDIGAVQPKAAGSSLIYKLTNLLSLQAIKQFGLSRISTCLALPLATGMTMTLALLSVRKSTSKYVIWFRIDQKSCFKAIFTSGGVPIIISPILSRNNQESLVTNIDQFKKVLDSIEDKDSIWAVISTTSCFAPREPDDVVAISTLCKEHNLVHIINNAYGLQDSVTCHNINEAIRVGKVDLVISSTDKNFNVPVGGSLIYSDKHESIDNVSKAYPGRASISPILDLFVTLLSMGRNGLMKLLQQRKDSLKQLKSSLETITKSNMGLRVLSSVRNNISVAVVIETNHLFPPSLKKDIGQELTYFGSLLFTRGISGVRVVLPSSYEKTSKTIDSHVFNGYGSHIDDYPVGAYFTVAAAIGITVEDVVEMVSRIEKVFLEYKEELKKKYTVVE
jgi:O-phospho-L-seryl-tRNASec:L-selenocysteinyl-tRNA synthase